MPGLRLEPSDSCREKSLGLSRKGCQSTEPKTPPPVGAGGQARPPGALCPVAGMGQVNWPVSPLTWRLLPSDRGRPSSAAALPSGPARPGAGPPGPLPVFRERVGLCLCGTCRCVTCGPRPPLPLTRGCRSLGLRPSGPKRSPPGPGTGLGTSGLEGLGRVHPGPSLCALPALEDRVLPGPGDGGPPWGRSHQPRFRCTFFLRNLVVSFRMLQIHMSKDDSAQATSVSPPPALRLASGPPAPMSPAPGGGGGGGAGASGQDLPVPGGGGALSGRQQVQRPGPALPPPLPTGGIATSARLPGAGPPSGTLSRSCQTACAVGLWGQLCSCLGWIG